MADILFATEKETTTIRATITRIIYAENGRCIARVMMDRSAVDRTAEADGKRRNVQSVLGSMVEPMVGQLYEFSGTIEFDDKYKQHQMRFDTYRTILPSDREGIASYLIDVAKWVGPSHAKALLDAFGSDTLRVLKEEPERVEAIGVAGLTADRIAEMSQSLKDNADLEAAAVEVNNLLGGVLGPATVRKAIRKWKSNAGTVLRTNPFALMELHGVGFISADAVNKKLGGDPRDLQRHAAALCHILTEAAQKDGHTVLSSMVVDAEGQRLVGGLLPEVLDLCTKDKSIETDGLQISLGSLARAESYIAGKLASMLAGHNCEDSPCARAENRNKLGYMLIDKADLADDQVAAVSAFEPSRVFILCGAPGTGKTYTVARIVRSLAAAGLRISMAAPTGKAAKQMNVALGSAGAVTIHSLLEPTINEETGEFSFSRTEARPLECDVLIVDEFSMVDTLLCRAMLRAVPETTRLLIVGDHYQLPSVGPGAVLRDLLRAGVPSYLLREIKRNAGRIVRACHAIKDGKEPEPAERLDLAAGDNWRHIACAGPEEIKAVISKLITDKLAAAGVDPLWGMQLISPTNESGSLSCDVLNELAKSLINDRPPAEKLRFSVGDKVVRTKNGYADGLTLSESDPKEDVTFRLEGTRIVNGDLGVIQDIEARKIRVRLRYPERVVFIPRAEHHLKMAYCLTCHKMQGSEVDVVILPLHRELARLPLVTREWIYTALSRARKFVVTVGDLSALRPLIGRVGNVRRNTLLGGLLRKRLAPQANDLENL